MPVRPGPEALLEAIARQAPALRQAGVLRVRLKECEFDLAPETPQMVTTASSPSERTARHPLDDLVTYGIDPRREDVVLPGYQRHEPDDP